MCRRSQTLQPSLTSWYINRHRVIETIGPAVVERYNCNLNVLSSLLGSAVLKWIRQQHVLSFTTLMMRHQLKRGKPFFHEARFYCRGLRARGPTCQHAMLSFPLRDLDPTASRRLELPFNSEGITTASAFLALQGSRHLFVCAVITEIDANRITARPLVIGHLVDDKQGLGPRLSDAIEVRAEEFNAFRKVDFTVGPTLSELAQLRNVPEAAVKDSFAEVFGEPFVDKDWGGEQADLFTSRPKINGRPTACAFAFKGPSHFAKLHPADCGKNGDQLTRLFTLPASCFVLQHCHAVSPHVRHIMRALTMEHMDEHRQFCIIDGSDTYLILKHLGVLPTRRRRGHGKGVE